MIRVLAVAAMLLLSGCEARARRCERMGGIVMQHRGTRVCVARDGLRFVDLDMGRGR